MSSHPTAYTDALERPEPDERQAIDAINASMRAILETTWDDYGHAVRSVHAKSHGLLQGELQVLGNPRPSRDTAASNLQHGVFHLLFGIATAVSADRIARRI